MNENFELVGTFPLFFFDGLEEKQIEFCNYLFALNTYYYLQDFNQLSGYL